MLYFSPLSVTDDKQRDRNHPFSSPQYRQGNGTIQGCSLLFVLYLDCPLLATFNATCWGGVVLGWLPTNVYAACSGGVVGLSSGDVDSCGDVPQYKVMKYLVFGVISGVYYYTHVRTRTHMPMRIVPRTHIGTANAHARRPTRASRRSRAYSRQKHKHKHIRVADAHVTRQSILGGVASLQSRRGVSL